MQIQTTPREARTRGVKHPDTIHQVRTPSQARSGLTAHQLGSRHAGKVLNHAGAKHPETEAAVAYTAACGEYGCCEVWVVPMN